MFAIRKRAGMSHHAIKKKIRINHSIHGGANRQLESNTFSRTKTKFKTSRRQHNETKPKKTTQTTIAN